MKDVDLTGVPFLVKGSCEGFFPHFSFDGRTCILFVYTGCGGNGNNFPTYEECNQSCRIAHEQGERRKDTKLVDRQGPEQEDRRFMIESELDLEENFNSRDVEQNLVSQSDQLGKT